VELSTQRFHEAVADRSPVDPAETLLIMVGRGSSMPEAIGQMHEFAALRSRTTPVGRVETCFVAMATPTLDATLAWAAETPYRRVVVQPHLLFVGDVLAEITAVFAEHAARQPQREWIVTPHLGPSPLVADAILDLARNLSR
jgi:sirohydrochlorin ferrochelatase